MVAHRELATEERRQRAMVARSVPRRGGDSLVIRFHNEPTAIDQSAFPVADGAGRVACGPIRAVLAGKGVQRALEVVPLAALERHELEIFRKGARRNLVGLTALGPEGSGLTACRGRVGRLAAAVV